MKTATFINGLVPFIINPRFQGEDLSMESNKLVTYCIEPPTMSRSSAVMAA